jgi:hypothetical protein
MSARIFDGVLMRRDRFARHRDKRDELIALG